jgi:hypothetical protein
MTGRGLAGRRQARRILFAAIALDAFVVFTFVAGPTTTGGLMGPVSPVAWIVPGVGILMNIAGLAWMVRILRADPEGAPRNWRATRER